MPPGAAHIQVPTELLACLSPHPQACSWAAPQPPMPGPQPPMPARSPDSLPPSSLHPHSLLLFHVHVTDTHKPSVYNQRMFAKRHTRVSSARYRNNNRKPEGPLPGQPRPWLLTPWIISPVFEPGLNRMLQFGGGCCAEQPRWPPGRKGVPPAAAKNTAAVWPAV